MFNPVKSFLYKRVIEVLTFDLYFHRVERLKNRHKTGIIVALGDSITAGFEVKPEERYTTVLESYLIREGFDDYSIIAQGVSGNKSCDGVLRLEGALALKPEILILELGGNDLLQGVDIEKVQENLAQIIKLSQAQGTEVLLVGALATVDFGVKYLWASRRMYRQLAKDFKLVLMPHIMRKTLLRTSLMKADHIHPKPAGYRVVASTMWPYLKKLL